MFMPETYSVMTIIVDLIINVCYFSGHSTLALSFLLEASSQSTVQVKCSS